MLSCPRTHAEWLLAAVVHRHIIRRTPRIRLLPFLGTLCSRIKHTDPVHAVFSEPTAILGIRPASARPGIRCGRLIEGDLAWAGIDPPDPNRTYSPALRRCSIGRQLPELEFLRLPIKPGDGALNWNTTLRLVSGQSRREAQ